jgi:Na+/phosphate symporter
MTPRDRRKKGNWSFKEQRQLIELASTSLSLETIGDNLNRSTASVLNKSVQLGLSVNGKPDGELGLKVKRA